MLIDKSVVTAALRRQGHHDRAQQADCSLSRWVDTRRDASLLRRYDVRLTDLVEGEDSAV